MIHFSNNMYKKKPIFVCIFLSLFMPFALGQTSAKIDFWRTQKKGANIFNASINREDIRAAKQYGIQFIRLAPDKFSTSSRDFLIGTADEYKGLIAEDLQKLKGILDICYAEQMPVVLTMLSLPGSRWKQNNNDVDDLRIWQNEPFQKQAVQFWSELAAELKNHPALIGYNILNEPHPERLYAGNEIPLHEISQKEVQGMLYHLYAQIIQAIRLVDTGMSIIIDSSAYADPRTFTHLKIYDDEHIIYSFHMYEPYAYTNQRENKGRFAYPGLIEGKEWNKEILKTYMESVIQFQQKYQVPSHRILVGEFGCHRMAQGIELYFKDLIAIFNEHAWHFAFYAFREDTWDGMDYELGNTKLPSTYWEERKKGKYPFLERSNRCPAFVVLEKAIKLLR